MLDCFLGLAMMVVGIILLAVGKISFGGKTEARGPLVRLAGGLLALTLPIYLGTAFLIGVNEGVKVGMNNGNAQAAKAELQAKVLEYWWVVLVYFAFMALLALVLVLCSIKPKERPRRRRMRDDSDDDRDDRRRRQYDGDDEDDDDRDGRYRRRGYD